MGPPSPHRVVRPVCLRNLGVFGDGDLSDLVLLAFQKYLSVCRALQRTYVLEPAGSHGVWSLDDYHLLPFLFGSAQLLGVCMSSARELRG